MRPFDGVLDTSNKTKYMNRNTANRSRGLSNYISDRSDKSDINHNNVLKNVNTMKVRRDYNNLINNLSSVDNVKVHVSDSSHRSEIHHSEIHQGERHHRSVRHHRGHRGHRGHRV